MIVQFVYPTTGQVTGGEAVLYELARGLARAGCNVNFLHGPAWPNRIDSLDQLPEIAVGDGVHHHLFDDIDDPQLPGGDVIFNTQAPARLGLPATMIQGHRMLSEEWERRAFRGPGPKICVASWLQDVGEAYGVRRDQLHHVPPGLDHERFRRTTPLTDRAIDVAMLHHPHREKDWPTAQAMLVELRERRPETRVVVFGRSLDDRIPAGVETVDSPDHRRLAEEIYAETRVFVQASRNEGFGLTPLEAMACGAALVSTDCGGSRDYARPGLTADVVPVEQPSALADAVIRLLDDEPRRLRYAQAGMHHAMTFDWDRSSEHLAEILERYVADPAPFLAPPLDG
ncbi:MAG: glycosyltransferase family 4 protein [Acidimicrobiales bacterium]